jgi:lipid A 3-O-deacylase PagL
MSCGKKNHVNVIWRVAFLALCLCAPCPSDAEDIRLMSVGIRGGVTGASVLGEEQQETFQEYDVVAHVRFPLGWYSSSGWGVGTGLIGSAGALTGGGDTGFIASLVPVLVFGSQDGRFSLDVGIGGALLSNHHFGRQDFGGPFQVTATAGITVPLYERIGIGYRFQHYSDATIYGSESRGADFHMFELTYRY